MASYKIIIVGSAKRGKTQWVNRLLLNIKEKRGYIPTQGVEVSSLTFPSGTIAKIWDTAGQERYRSLGDGYYVNANAALIFADNEEEASYWVHEVLRVCPLIALFVMTGKPSSFSNRLPIKDKSKDPSSILEELLLHI